MKSSCVVKKWSTYKSSLPGLSQDWIDLSFHGSKKTKSIYIYIYTYIFNQVNEFKSHFAWSYFEMLWWKNLRRLLIIFSISKALLKVINFIFKDVGIFQPFSPNTTYVDYKFLWGHFLDHIFVCVCVEMLW